MKRASKPSSIAVYSLLATLGTLALTWTGCTGDGNEPARQVVVQQSVQAVDCPSESLSQNEIPQGAVVIDPANLPKGVFLYDGAQLDAEIFGRKQRSARIQVREKVASKGFQSEVVCARQSGELAIDVVQHGLTKIESNGAGETSVTLRQYQVFLNSRSQGAVNLNPRLQSKPVRTLADFLAGQGAGAILFKLPDGKYVMRVYRDSGELRSRLDIAYEFVAKN